MQREVYWLWLSLKEINNRKTIKLLDYFSDVQKIYEANRQELSAAVNLTEKELSALLDKDLSTAEAELNMCSLCHVDILPFDHALYPKELRQLPDAPLLFYTMGDWSLLKESPKLTIVGPRKCDQYGSDTAFSFSRELASSGVVIVSGMAEGIDGYAHAGALRGRGKTIAILGCGIDVDYPKDNLELKKEVAEKGLVLSEFPLGTEPYRTNFPFRNRVLAALSDGILVVEAGKRSGALITAHCGTDQGKEVFAIPGNITSLLSEGTNGLIRDGEAVAALSPSDVLSALLQEKQHYVYPVIPEIARIRNTEKPKEKQPVKIKKERSPEEEKILAVLDREMDIDLLGRLTGIPGGKINSILTLMEMDGLVEKRPGNRYRKCVQ